MQQSTSPAEPLPLHVGIIMDGNGRWATRQGRSRAEGHRAGAAMVRRIVEAAPDAGVGVLTLFAFSADNWRRPRAEVGWLMRLFREYLRVECARCVANGVRLEVIGRRDRIGRSLRAAVEHAERETARGTRLHLRIALDYSARDAILRAAQCLQPGAVPSRDSFGRLLAIVPAASAASATSCCGRPRTPSCTSRRSPGRSSAPRRCRMRYATSRRASGGTAGCRTRPRGECVSVPDGVTLPR
jgi:hypothetical protein